MILSAGSAWYVTLRLDNLPLLCAVTGWAGLPRGCRAGPSSE